MATQIGLDFQSGDAVLEINQFATKVENNERGIRFQVAAIVKKLPQNADAVITEAAWSILDANREERDYTNRFAKKCFLVSADTSVAQQNYAIRSQDSAVTFNESFVISSMPIHPMTNGNRLILFRRNLNPRTNSIQL